MTATVDVIDKSASSITFAGPNGQRTADVSSIRPCSTVKVGDKVDITWNTDVTVAVVIYIGAKSGPLGLHRAAP